MSPKVGGVSMSLPLVDDGLDVCYIHQKESKIAGVVVHVVGRNTTMVRYVGGLSSSYVWLCSRWQMVFDGLDKAIGEFL